MEYMKIVAENIDTEHVCCAMSNNQSDKKKEWMKQRFADGLVFYRSVERGKCFIEYMPAENAWHPIEAEGYMHINCLWVSGSFKGHGYANDLLNECIRDAKEKGKKGLCIISSAKKKGFLADPKFLSYKGFKMADEAVAGIQLWYLPFKDEEKVPCFKECAKAAKVDEKGFVIYYSDQCPFTYYWVPRLQQVAAENGIQLSVHYINSKEEAQNAPSPVTNFTIFKDGKFISHEIQNEKKFLSLANKE